MNTFTVRLVIFASLAITTCLGQTTDPQYIAQRAAVDAFIGFPDLHLSRGSDGKFNWFEVGLRSDTPEELWTNYYHRDKKDPNFKIYCGAFKDEIERICLAIQERIDEGEATNWKQAWKQVPFPNNLYAISSQKPDPMFSEPIQTQSAAPIDEVLSGPSPAIAKAESQLRCPWNLLSPARKAELRDEQERWERIKDKSNDQIKLQMIQERIIYLLNRA
jgi:hypothetical protein